MDAYVRSFSPVWKTPSRDEAVRILVETRQVTDALVADLEPRQLDEIRGLGGGSWSIKDLLGHLATWEERGLFFAGVREHPGTAEPSTTDDFNRFHVERKSAWSPEEVVADSETVRAALIAAISDMPDERWREKIQTRTGKSALGLVLGNVLAGAKYGLFAHDLAHYRDLKAAVTAER